MRLTMFWSLDSINFAKQYKTGFLVLNMSGLGYTRETLGNGYGIIKPKEEKCQ